MNLATELVIKPAFVTSELDVLDLDEATLQEAVRVGVTYALECTALDAPTAAGFFAWAKGIRTLRELLLPRGWNAVTEMNYPTVVHPRAKLAIAMASGDRYTGTATSPATRADKGMVTRLNVLANQGTFASLAEEWEEFTAATAKGIPTWLLLYFIDEKAGEVRLELSLPTYMSDDGHVAGWRKRVIISSISLDPTPTTYVDADDVYVRVERIDNRAS